NDTVRYYRTEARGWEKQVMIRSRPSAGDGVLFKTFFSAIENSIFSVTESVEHALAGVRHSKEQIDQEQKNDRGFNVKLGRGGIREIEFVAQALQLAYGGKDRWLRSPHTLISLTRLADRGLLTSRELTELVDAYAFLRRLEHILQMEHGVQTHTLPDEEARRRLIASKMDPAEPKRFEKRLLKSTRDVSRVFERIFADSSSDAIETMITRRTENERRTLTDPPTLIDTKNLPAAKITSVEQLQRNAPRFAVLLRSDPDLIEVVPDASDNFQAFDYREKLTTPDTTTDFRGRLRELRRAWHKQILGIAVFDAIGKLSLNQAKDQQTLLAEAAIDAAFSITADEMASRLSIPARPLNMAALALGKLGGRGVDYDSDLDLILVYDDAEPPPDPRLTHAEFFGRAAELFVNSLSSMTREGSLYRVDLRLRPHGKNGPNAVSSKSLCEYAANEAAIWELLAYAKLRAAGGDAMIGERAETVVREIVHERSSAMDPGDLAETTRNVRGRLEAERAGRLKPNEIDIKYGAGGLLDIYFATRFLQLRDNVRDGENRRSTTAILESLRSAGSLAQPNFEAFSAGHGFLSKLDHSIRLLLGRSTRVPISNGSAMNTIADRMDLASTSELLQHLTLHRLEIRRAFERTVDQTDPLQ
ncbi:MAG: hypothetical protein ABI999_02620, partial [Acidobacteriota bacterium]